MYCRLITPIKQLQNYIRYFWILEDIECSSDFKYFKTIPDGLPALIFQEKTNLFWGEDGEKTPQLFIYGQSTKPRFHFTTGNFRMIGVYLEPFALKTIFGFDAFELNNQNISLNHIVTESLLDQLINSKSLENKIEIISHFFLSQIKKVNRINKKAEFASTLLLTGNTLSNIQLQTNLSERSLERLIKQYVGLSPKMFLRIIRFQKGLDLLRQPNFKSCTKIGYECNYYDQSHFIRDFKEFTGTNPKNYILNANEPIANFLKWKTS